MKLDINSLREVELAEEQAFSSKDPEKWLSFVVSEHACHSRQGQYQGVCEDCFCRPCCHRPIPGTRADVAQSADIGYTQGTVTSTTTDPKTRKPMNDRGKWLSVRKKQSDGSWKIVQDTFSSDLPLSNLGK
jgi:ketosteroid isomerase-like protein